MFIGAEGGLKSPVVSLRGRDERLQIARDIHAECESA
jgi:hypothetical protein